jgi:hypothetical protein
VEVDIFLKNKTEQEKERDLEVLAVEAVMSTEGGRHFVYRILSQTGIYADVFHINPYKHSHLSGKRSAGIWIESEIKNACHDKYIKMLAENYQGVL